ncbi:hypothetical protein Neosp_014407 [[Neocosmospora] mangrovei]
MPSREVVQHFEDISKEATGEGPIQEITTVQSTGARTPFSIAAEIEAQVAATKARRESEAMDREKAEAKAKAKREAETHQ